MGFSATWAVNLDNMIISKKYLDNMNCIANATIIGQWVPSNPLYLLGNQIFSVQSQNLIRKDNII